MKTSDQVLLEPSWSRRSALSAGLTIGVMPWLARAQSTPMVRIGVPTKTYFPTIIAETALRQNFMRKKGYAQRSQSIEVVLRDLKHLQPAQRISSITLLRV